VLWLRVGLDQCSYPTSGPVSTGMGNVHEFKSRSHPLSIQSAIQANSAWSSLWDKLNETGVKTGKVTADYGRGVVHYP